MKISLQGYNSQIERKTSYKIGHLKIISDKYLFDTTIQKTVLWQNREKLAESKVDKDNEDRWYFIRNIIFEIWTLPIFSVRVY